MRATCLSRRVSAMLERGAPESSGGVHVYVQWCLMLGGALSPRHGTRTFRLPARLR
jgi:hypothetical protein